MRQEGAPKPSSCRPCPSGTWSDKQSAHSSKADPVMLLEDIVQQCRIFEHGWKVLVIFFGGGFFLGTPAEEPGEVANASRFRWYVSDGCIWWHMMTQLSHPMSLSRLIDVQRSQKGITVSIKRCQWDNSPKKVAWSCSPQKLNGASWRGF